MRLSIIDSPADTRARAAHHQLAIAPRPVLYVGSMDVALADLLLTTARSVRKRLDLLRPVEPAAIGFDGTRSR